MKEDTYWAKKDYSYNKTRKKLIASLKKLDTALQLSSTISASERDTLWCLIDYVKNRHELASLKWKIARKEGEGCDDKET